MKARTVASAVGAGRRAAAVADVAQLEQPGEDDRRDREQEASSAPPSSRSRSEQQPGRDRRARAADARARARAACAKPMMHAVAEGEVLERLALRRPRRSASSSTTLKRIIATPMSSSVRNSCSIVSLNARPRTTDRDRAEDRCTSRAGTSSVPRTAGSRSPASQPWRWPTARGGSTARTASHRPELHDGGERGARVLPAEERGDDPQVRGAEIGRNSVRPCTIPSTMA